MRQSNKIGIWIAILLMLITPIMAQDYAGARDYTLNEALKLATVDSDFDYMIKQVKQVKSMNEAEVLRFIQRINEKRQSIAQNKLTEKEKITALEEVGGGFVDDNRTIIYVILAIIFLGSGGIVIDKEFGIKDKLSGITSSVYKKTTRYHDFRNLNYLVNEIRKILVIKNHIIKENDEIIIKNQQIINKYNPTNTIFKTIGHFNNIELIDFVKKPLKIYVQEMSRWKMDFKKKGIFDDIRGLRHIFDNKTGKNNRGDELNNLNKKETKLFKQFLERLNKIDTWVEDDRRNGIDTANSTNKVNACVSNLQAPI